MRKPPSPASLGILAVLLGAQLPSSSATATVQQPRSIAQLAAAADLIAVVQPLGAGSFHQGTRILTLVDCRLLAVWHDPQGRLSGTQRLSIMLPGGRVDDIGPRGFGGPLLPVGQAQVAFLRWPQSATGEWEIVGLAQGLCRLGEAQAELVSRPLDPATAAHCGAHGAAHTLGGLQRQVRDAIAAAS